MPSMKPNGSWIGRILLPNGKRKNRVFPTRDRAVEWENQCKRNLRLGLPLVDEKRPTVGSFFPSAFEVLYNDRASYFERKSKLATIMSIIGEDVLLTRITRTTPVVLNHKLHERGIEPQSVNGYVGIFNRIMQYAYDEQQVATVIRMKYNQSSAVRKDRVVSQEEEKMILEMLASAERNLTVFLLYTGLRISEAFRVRAQDLDQGYLTVKRSKSGKISVMPLAKTAIDAFERQARTTNDERIFGSLEASYYTTLKRTLKRLGIEDVTPHTFRHTAASRLVRGGVDLCRVKEFLGHAQITTTMVYAHLAPENLQVASDVLDGLATT